MLNCTPFHKGMGASVSHSGGKRHLQGPTSVRRPAQLCAPRPHGSCVWGGWKSGGASCLSEALGGSWGCMCEVLLHMGPC